jgi:inosine-uridine nucleoside N-ribohydrolase
MKMESPDAKGILMTNQVSSLLVVVALLCCLAAGGYTTAHGDPVRIIFDTDMGSDCDDAGALAVLHVYADRGLAEIIGCIYSSGKVPYGAGVVEAINIYYGRPEIPVGAAHDDEVGDPVDKMTAEKLAKDTAAFGNTIIHSRDAEEMTALNRRLLAREQDHSVVYLTVGHTKGFHDLLVSKPDNISALSGRELVEKKVKRWVAMGAEGADNKEGHFRREWNLHFNGSAPYTKYLVEKCPVPIVYIATGKDVYTGQSLKNTPPGNIVRTVYRDWLWNVEKKTLDDQRPSWDLVAVQYAVDGPGEFLVADEDGWLEFDVDKGSRWIRGERRNPQKFVTLKPGMNTAMANYLNAMLAATPGWNPETMLRTRSHGPACASDSL